MKAVIFAGGHGTRFIEKTQYMLKPMIGDIGGKIIKVISGVIKYITNSWGVYKLKKLCPNLVCPHKKVINNYIIDKGKGNSIVIECGGELSDCEIVFYGNNCVLHIGRNVVIHDNHFWFEDEGGVIIIGDNTSTESGCKFASCEGKKVVIGKDCMLSHDIDIRNTDSHSILNEKGERTNPSADIIIGNHVWIGIRNTILKGSIIPSESVVAAQSMVTSSLKADEHSLIAGVPAKVVRNNISWERKRL